MTTLKRWTGTAWEPVGLPNGGNPVGTLAYARHTATVTGAATGGVVDVPGAEVTVVVPAGRTLRITISAVTYNNTVTGRTDLQLMEGTTFLTNAETEHTVAGWGSRSTAHAIVSPSAGSHTYKMRLRSTNQQGFIYADNDVPAWILVEDITPTPQPANTAPSATLAYADVTTIQSGITTMTDLIGLAATVTVGAGRRLRITGYLPEVINNTLNQGAYAHITEDGVVIGQGDTSHGAANAGQQLIATVVHSPTAGTHTYKIRLAAQGAGTVTNGAAAAAKPYILVEDITAVTTEGSALTTLQTLTAPLQNNAMTAYTPVWTASGGATGLGAGTLTGRYYRIGRMVFVQIEFKYGSGMSLPSGNYMLSLPFEAAAGPYQPMSASYWDLGTGMLSMTASPLFSSAGWSQVGIHYPGSASAWGLNVPVVPAVGDFLNVWGWYLAAS